jgi:hypothetical protein
MRTKSINIFCNVFSKKPLPLGGFEPGRSKGLQLKNNTQSWDGGTRTCDLSADFLRPISGRRRVRRDVRAVPHRMGRHVGLLICQESILRVSVSAENVSDIFFSFFLQNYVRMHRIIFFIAHLYIDNNH